MNQTYISQGGWTVEYQKPLFYSVWLIGDQKWGSVALLGLFVLLVLSVSHLTQSLFGGLLVFCLVLPTLWSLFVPTHIEINSDGIVRKVLGRRSFIAWDDIRAYRVRKYGMLLLPSGQRYFLEAFRAYYLPVPSSLSIEVLYRFRVYVDRFVD